MVMSTHINKILFQFIDDGKKIERYKFKFHKRVRDGNVARARSMAIQLLTFIFN